MNFKPGHLLLIFALMPVLLSAQDMAKQEYTAKDLALRDVAYMVIPILSYAPETQFGFGAGGQFLFRTPGSDSTSRISNALLLAMVTTKKQFILEFIPQIYFRNESYYLESKFKYKIFPNSFWGIGNDTPESQRENYDMRSIRLQTQWLKKLPPYYSFGIQYTIESNKILRVVTGGILDADSIQGSSRSVLSGLGLIFRFDNRDNYFAPGKGYFGEFQTNFTSKAMGSTHSFNEYILDFRTYITFFKRQVLALQGYAKLTYDDVPFQALAYLGGAYRNRGYFEGRYMDKHLLSAQAEYRIPIHPRWSINAFIAVGEVADEVSHFGKSPKWSSGGGIRFKIKRGSPTTIRFDVGIGQNNNIGAYFGVNEVF